MSTHFLIVILGPTASGKTALAIEIAKAFDTEIISADSRQFYQEMNIGTAKPTPEERKQVKHHLIDSLSITEEYNAGKFEKDTLRILENIFAKKNTAVMAGGSGMYIDAVCRGFDKVPEADHEVREELMFLYKEKGIEALRLMLKKLDEEHYKKADLSNPHRLIRALEVCLATGKPYSGLRKGKKQKRNFTTIKIGLGRPREKLYERINMRVDEMMKSGLLEEVKTLRPFREGVNALNTVGYKELFEYLEGKTDLNSAVEKIKQNTRNFARRQMTWFRKDEEIQWFDPGEPEKIIQVLKNEIKR